MSRKPKPITRAEAIMRVARGESLRTVAALAGVTATTVQRWSRAAAPPPPEAPPLRSLSFIPPPPAVAEDGEPPPLGDTLDTLRKMLARTLQRAQQSERDGNMTAAQRLGRDAAALMITLARAEKDAQKGTDGIHITREEIEQQVSLMRERIAAITSRPLLCAHCSRALSVSFSGRKAART